MKLIHTFSKEERKAHDALRIRLLQLFVLIFATVATISLSFGALFEVNSSKPFTEDIFFLPCLIVLFNIVPIAMKYSWKELIPQVVIQSALTTLVILILHRVW